MHQLQLIICRQLQFEESSLTEQRQKSYVIGEHPLVTGVLSRHSLCCAALGMPPSVVSGLSVKSLTEIVSETVVSSAQAETIASLTGTVMETASLALQ